MDKKSLDITPSIIKELQAISEARRRVNRSAGKPVTSIKEGKQCDLEGVIGEYTAHKLLDLPWGGKFFDSVAKTQAYKKAGGRDVGPFEIKTITEYDHSLIIQPSELEDGSVEAPYILVYWNKEKNVCFLMKWEWGKEAVRKAGLLKDVGYGLPAYYCKQRHMAGIIGDQAFQQIIEETQSMEGKKMKAKISATFERYFQHKAYDGEKIILSVEQDIDDVDPPAAAAALHRRLAEIGDGVTAKRLGQVNKEAAPKKPTEPPAPW